MTLHQTLIVAAVSRTTATAGAPAEAVLEAHLVAATRAVDEMALGEIPLNSVVAAAEVASAVLPNQKTGEGHVKNPAIETAVVVDNAAGRESPFGCGPGSSPIAVRKHACAS